MGTEDQSPAPRRSRAIWVSGATGAWLGLAAGSAVGASHIAAQGYAADGLWLNALRTLTDAALPAVAAGTGLGLALGALWAHRSGRARPPGAPGAGSPRAAVGLVVALAIAVGLEAGEQVWISQRAAVPGRLNVLLLLVDTLRADHLGVYGYDRETSPTIDRLAARGTLFTRAISPADKTRTAMASLWTGLYPSRHGLFTRETALSPRFHTAAEWAREAGYRTAAFAPNPSLDRRFGHAQGWDLYVDRALRASGCSDVPEVCFETARRIQSRALDWLESGSDRPFLLWMHYRDVHGPYVPPPPYDGMFQSETVRPISPREARRRDRYLDLPDDGGDLNHYLDRYDGGIRYTDDRIAEFLSELEDRGWLENTLIVIAADHGEEFLDHGQWNHGQSLYEELLHVPLVVLWPGAEPRVETRPISTLAFFPTILRAMGLDPPASDGVDVTPLVRDGVEVALPETVFSERKRGAMRSVRRGDWKRIENEADGWMALFDVGEDPQEHDDRSRSAPTVAADLSERLHRFADEVERNTDAPPSQIALDEELRQRLEALGYVE
jgi:arylsulfatase A-like enzyme